MSEFTWFRIGWLPSIISTQVPSGGGSSDEGGRGSQWCAYCGSTANLRRCIKCKDVFYCGKVSMTGLFKGERPMV